MKSNNFYHVPENYFEELPQRIQKRMAEKQKNKPVWAFALRYALPVVVLGLFGLGYYALNQPLSEPQIEVSEAVIAEYLLANGVSDTELASFADNESLDNFIDQTWDLTEEEINEEDLETNF